MRAFERTGFDDFDRLLAVVRRTRELLEAVATEGELPPDGAEYISDATLAHLEGVQTGFQGWLRADAADLAELRYLLRQAGSIRASAPRDDAEQRAAAAEALLERALAGRPGRAIRGVRPWDLIALSHARVVLALLPRLPDESVRYPAGRRTYADIPAPRGPAELAARIDELVRQLWRTAAGPPPTPRDPAFRRTYGFFDAADRLGWRAMGPHG